MVTPTVGPPSEAAADRGPERADCGGTSGATPKSASGATCCGGCPDAPKVIPTRTPYGLINQGLINGSLLG